MRRYGPVARAFLASRWKGSSLASEVDDAVQDVLLACLERDGAFAGFRPARRRGFGAYFIGIVRHFAQRYERRRALHREQPPGHEPAFGRFPAPDPDVPTLLDRDFARTVVEEALLRHEQRNRRLGGTARLRFRVLELRFREGLPIREIARRLGESPVRLHRQCAVARRELREALLAVMALRHPGGRAELMAACEALLAIFS